MKYLQYSKQLGVSDKIKINETPKVLALQ